MERVGIEANLSLNVSGTEDAKQLNEQLKLSEEQQKRLNELDAYNSNNQKGQQIQAQTQALKEYTAAQEEATKHLAETSGNSGYAAQGAKMYAGQQEQAAEQMRKFPLHGNDTFGNGQQEQQQQARQQEIARLSAKIEDLLDELDDIQDKMDSAKQADDTRGMLNLSTARENTEAEKSSLEQKLKKLLGEEKNGGGNLSKYFGMKEFQQAIGFAVQGLQIGSNYRTDIANGNYIGAGVNRGKTAGDTVGGVAMAAGTGMMLVPGLQLPGAIVAGAGGLVKGTTDVIAGYQEAGNAEAGAYERSIPHVNELHKLFNGGDWSNSGSTDALLLAAEEKSRSTNMGVYDFLDASKNMARYGMNQSDSLSLTRQAALMTNNTGADISTVQNLLGTIQRYGGNTVSNDYLSKARNAAGMDKAQSQEFLNAMLSVVEEGISNGYVNSVEQVANNMTMFAKLSNGSSLWTGGQGARRMSQIQGGMSSSTGMNDVGDLIVTSAARDILNNPNISEEDKKNMLGYTDPKNKTMSRKTGTYIDEMLLMENGKDPRMFNSVIKNVQSMEGGNIAAQIERYKDIFGLNYAGAVDIYNMSKNGTMSQSQIQQKIQSMQSDQNYQSDETKKMDAINRLDTNVAELGKPEFWKNVAELEKMADEKKGELLGTGNASSVDTSMERQGLYQKTIDNVLSQQEYPKSYRGMYGSKPVANTSDIIIDRKPSKSAFTSDYLGFLLKNKSEGNDAFDEIIKHDVGKVANADGVVTNSEVTKLLQQLVNNTAFAAAYTGKDESALRKVLQDTFTNMVVQLQ
jgi:hypothetical protein